MILGRLKISKFSPMRFILPLVLLITFSSCSHYLPYPAHEKNAMTAFSFPEREGSLEVFFQGESEPEKDYLRLDLLKETKLAYGNDIGALLERLKTRSLKIGADALIVMGTSDFEEVSSNGEDNIRTIPRENMWGIAIRYVDSIEYRTNLPSHLTVTPHGRFAEEKGGDIRIDNNGELEKPAPNYWTDYAYYHSLHYLLDNTKNWWYAKRANIATDFELLLTRQLGLGLEKETKLKARINEDERIDRLNISHLAGQATQISMVINYDEENRITGWKWQENLSSEIEVTRSYHANGTVQQDTYVQRKTTAKETMDTFLVVTHHYLSREGFLRKLNAEQIIRVKK